jgi:drug/metabolite transporter (DMT)-like permease
MNDSLIILVGGLGAAISWGISDYLAAHSAKKIGPILASAVINILGSLLFIIIYFLFFREQTTSSLSGIIYSSTAGIALSLGAYALFKGLEKGPVSIVSPLTSLYPLVTTLLAVAVFSAKLSFGQSLGIMLIILGVIVASGLASVKKSERKIASGPKYALLAALFWGIGYSLLAQGIQKIGWQASSVIEFAFVAISFVVLTPLFKGGEKINSNTILAALKNKYILGTAIIQLAGVIALNFALSKESSSGAIVTAISATYPLLTVFLALKHMKEKVDLLPLLGAFAGIIGVIIVVLN